LRPTGPPFLELVDADELALDAFLDLGVSEGGAPPLRRSLVKA
jgi:hypothetical protein